MLARCAFIFAACAMTGFPSAFCAAIVIRTEPIHLRSGKQREWRSFPVGAQGPAIELTFAGRENAHEYSLVLRQRDVKASWTTTLNDVAIGALIADERDMLRILAVPPGVLRTGLNRLRITGKPGGFSDDIEIRDLRIEDVSPADLQRQSTIDISVTGESRPVPARITVVDRMGSLVPIRALRVGALEAIRTGVIYTSDGQTSIGVPAGEYQIYASRGFEYSAPSATVQLAHGQRASIALKIRREVTMSGYVSCDTHVHTLELSGHGDASVDERVLAAAGEGLDLIVATEHNRFADYAAALRKLGLNRWTTSIPGTEVTTAIGHFNIFPVLPTASHPDLGERDWRRLMETLRSTEGVRVVVQNHPRDLHSKYRPFDPAHHISSLGENLEDRPFLANAMEVVNSGAMASDPLQLVRDWLGLLTRGETIAAIGASDTHTVDFVPIGQARTYIDVTAVPDWRNNFDGVTRQLAAGRNLVSYGLAIDLRQAGAVRLNSVPIDLTVWGPSWSAADHVAVYSNGARVWQRKLGMIRKPGRKFSATMQIPIADNDTALVAVVTGPGVQEPFWEVRKPYQPTSDEWSPIVLGVSRAVWIDSDGSGSREAPLDHARRLIEKHGLETGALIRALSKYDKSVAMHVLNLLHASGYDMESEAIQGQFASGSAEIREAYRGYMQELGASRLRKRNDRSPLLTR
jgi:hypothetical protein